MRLTKGTDQFKVKVIAGTHVVLMALDMDEATRQGLRGFAIKRGLKGQPQEWLKGIKYFQAFVPNPKAGDDYSSREQPFQSFLWSDYRASPGTEYDFTIVALYGDLHAMEERHTLEFSIATETEEDAKGGVWFNRGTIASHAFETQFHNRRLTDEMVNNVSDDGKLLDPETQWLSRGLAEACLRYINGTKPGEALRVCAYEFTYQPVLGALKRALDRGVDVRIVYHDTKKPKDPNRAAIAQAKLPQSAKVGGKDTQILFPRTRTAIPHNKFIVKLVGGAPAELWTGSTNFTDSGFFGQTNVGHLVKDGATAKTYLDYWTELSGDPVHKQALANALALTPNPPNVIKAASTVGFFSPRIADNMLDWYGQRITDTVSLAMMTIPFNVAPTILTALAKKGDAMRFVILEDIPSPQVKAAEKANQGKLAFSNGALMGMSFVKRKSPTGGATVTPIPNSDLDKWFLEEELARPANSGHVFFVHSKVLLIDPLSDDPLVCSGSANFSKNSLVANDENMLLVRGDARVADIYMTELDRIFRHFRARDIINDKAASGSKDDPLILDPTDQWIAPNFTAGNYKNNRRLLFFPTGESGASWSAAAGKDPNPFKDEDARAAQIRADKNQKARDRKAAGGGTSPATKAAGKPAGAKPSAPRRPPARGKPAAAARGGIAAPAKPKAAAAKAAVAKTAPARGKSRMAPKPAKPKAAAARKPAGTRPVVKASRARAAASGKSAPRAKAAAKKPARAKPAPKAAAKKAPPRGAGRAKAQAKPASARRRPAKPR